MSVIIFGRRSYGRVHEHGGEFADTQFFHIQFVPLLPLGSHWITRVVGDERVGFPIGLHLPSVIATYLRFWAPIAAIAIYVASGAMIAAAAAIGLVALSAWSWMSRSRRGGRAQQRSDFDRVALGTRCDPAWMLDPMRRRISRELGAELARRKDARSPEDVARFGATDVEEALLAYGLLRLSARDHRQAAADADRLLSAAFDQLPRDGGPYRERLVQSVPELREAIAAQAGAHAAASARAAAGTKRRWFQRPGLQLVGLLLLAPTALAGARQLVNHVVPERTVGASELGSVRQPLGKHVRLRCDSVEDPGWRTRGDDGSEQEVALCWVGGHLLPVVSAAGDQPTAGTIDGKLQMFPSLSWVKALQADPRLDAAAYDVYLMRDDDARDRQDIATCLGLLTLSTLGWVFWIRGFMRRRRAS
jgi:hypothetical protein